MEVKVCGWTAWWRSSRLASVDAGGASRRSCGLSLRGRKLVRGSASQLLETRHVKAALSAMTVKTDRKGARGIAQLLRMGWFRSVHCKLPTSQEVHATQ